MRRGLPAVGRRCQSGEKHLESARVKDLDLAVFLDLQQVLVSRYEEIGFGRDGAEKNEVVVRIADDARQLSPGRSLYSHDRDFAKKGESVTDLFFCRIQLLFEGALEFLQDDRTDEENELALVGPPEQLRAEAVGREGGDEDVRVENTLKKPP